MQVACSTISFTMFKQHVMLVIRINRYAVNHGIQQRTIAFSLRRDVLSTHKLSSNGGKYFSVIEYIAPIPNGNDYYETTPTYLSCDRIIP